MVTWIYGRTSFVVERNVLGHLKLQTWAIPKYNIQVIKHFPFSEKIIRVLIYIIVLIKFVYMFLLSSVNSVLYALAKRVHQ